MSVVFQLYSKDDCPWCQKAVVLLTERGIPHNVQKINCVVERNEMYDSFGLVGKLRTVPQVVAYHDGGVTEHVGGYQDLVEYLDTMESLE